MITSITHYKDLSRKKYYATAIDTAALKFSEHIEFRISDSTILFKLSVALKTFK